MNTFLHFIGNRYYTIASFCREAKKHGVTRRVSLKVLKQMAWGDRVVCAQKNGKTGIAFGVFTIQRISGLTPEAIEKLRGRHAMTVVDFGGTNVERGCGSYTCGPTWTINASIEEICNVLEELKNPGKPLISGHFTKFPFVPINCEYVRLLDIPFRQGFRLFDWARFVDAVKSAQMANFGARTVKVRGQFYVTALPGEKAGEVTPTVQAVYDYRLKG